MPTDADPLYDECRRHGDEHIRRFDNALRNRVRERAEDCERCAELIEAFDREFLSVFMGGTGPFAR